MSASEDQAGRAQVESFRSAPPTPGSPNDAEASRGASAGADGNDSPRPGTGREETGDRILRRGEAALARTRLPVWEWSLALFDAKQYLVAANKEFSSGPAQLLKSKRPGLADLARRIRVVEKQIETQLDEDDDRHTELIEGGDFSTFIASMEHGWWLREELHGKGTDEVHKHVEDLVLMLNNVAMHLVNLMTPHGNDSLAQSAYNYLKRAELLTDNSDAVPNEQTRTRLRAVGYNNMGCYYERRNKLLKSLEFLDRALRLELDVKLVEDPSATHLNLCRVLSRLKKHDAAFQHARCAIGSTSLQCSICFPESFLNAIQSLTKNHKCIHKCADVAFIHVSLFHRSTYTGTSAASGLFLGELIELTLIFHVDRYFRRHSPHVE